MKQTVLNLDASTSVNCSLENRGEKRQCAVRASIFRLSNMEIRFCLAVVLRYLRVRWTTNFEISSRSLGPFILATFQHFNISSSSITTCVTQACRATRKFVNGPSSTWSHATANWLRSVAVSGDALTSLILPAAGLNGSPANIGQAPARLPAWL